MITNEEKAEDLISNEFAGTRDLQHVLIYNAKGICEYLIIRMAKWKDQQFQEEKKQWIEKACKWLDNWFTNDIGQCKIPITKFARNEFFKYFKQAMEE